MTIVPAGEVGPPRSGLAPLKLDDARATPNGARPLVTLVLSRPLTEYESLAALERFPLAFAPAGSTEIMLRTMRRSRFRLRARLTKDVKRISERAIALEREHQKIFEKVQSALKARPQAAKGVKPPSA
jgi:hypothetical protein